MKYKSDWDEAQKRLTALWYGERLDRPCISITCPRQNPEPVNIPTPLNDEARWLDPNYVVPLTLNIVRGTWWGGEAVPGHFLMATWVNCLGGEPEFDERTIWFKIQEIDFSKPSPFRHDPNNIWTLKYKKLVSAMCKAAGKDDFAVGSCLAGLPVNDLLSMIMGTETFLMALIDHSEWMKQAIIEGARDRLTLTKEIRNMIKESGHLISDAQVGWMPFWAPESYALMQSDVSCMLSPEMFDEFVLPELEMAAAELGPIWYHLDGGNAKQHLPRLLSLPFMRIIQYTPAPFEPPNGPAHLDMYKEIQSAGKIVHIQVPIESVEPLVRSLDPSKLMLHTNCKDKAEGEMILEKAIKWTSSPKK